ncbi:glycosyltransferase family 87 protein [Octadecabacter ascidiaceicola]|uniref:Polyprenol-phosphate-mannose-dependent alpha-(1-2)-phosphatidylinositol mannoside mannosyltransferase n=1 Tax=Octadecabacter ascidiaceicola TaxID=1655543 RepID=A0A238KA50_9RHOB|nr:glycosyltransferase family 87 protein [Octadecabacter ascidiaceicola]SMX39729.1 hypothetical protein OCA8868_02101 [Octadecabacter ascidiaceicola]
MTRPALLNIICVTAIAFLTFSVIHRALGAQSADLYAFWLAGEFLSMERLDQIYPANAEMFDMTTPSDWWGYVSETDPSARIFPYLYPPIWAKLASWLTQVTNFETFDAVMTIVHQGLIIGSIYLAAKMCDLKGTVLFGFIALTYAALAFTFPVGIAIEENQPQIIVSFLVVWAFERAHFGHFKSAGGILALAAAIKLYPLLFIVILLARKQWGALATFVVAGALLGGLSILLVGWDIHVEYLKLVSVVSKSVIVNNFTFSFDSVFARIFLLEYLTEVRQPRSVDGSEFWGAIAKTPLWLVMSGFAQLAALGAAFWLAARHKDEALVIPVVAILFAILSPLSWCYSYMTALVFVGTLPLKLGRLGLYIAIGSALFFLPAMEPFTTGSAYSGPNLFQIVGTSLMAVLGLAFWLAVRRGGR